MISNCHTVNQAYVTWSKVGDFENEIIRVVMFTFKCDKSRINHHSINITIIMKIIILIMYNHN